MPDGLGPKTTLDMSDGIRNKLGLKPAVHELLHVRERWAKVTNEALIQADIAARIDHRSLAAQGIDREPRPHIPRAAFEMERHGYRSVVAERMREDHAARVQSRVAAAALSAARGAAVKPQSLEDIRREARESWLQMRQNRLRGDDAAAAKPADHTHDDDLAQ